MTSSVSSPPADIPSSVDKYLAPGEQVVESVKRHWSEIFWPGVSVYGGIVFALFLETLLPLAPVVRTIMWLVLVAVVSYLVWRIVERSLARFIITNKRFILTQGVLTRRINMMPLARVTDMRYERPFLGRIFGYGTFILESAGQDQALREITFLPEADRLYRVVNGLLFPVEKKESDE